MEASAIFERFVQASTFRGIQQTFFQLCCSLNIQPWHASGIYEKIRLLDQGKTYSKANKLWALLDKKKKQPEYCSQKACTSLNVLVIGAGPCGLRAAIECALLGAHVVVVEQRDKFSRNNVLHLWNFVIQDLKTLGGKIFFPKFCTGSIEHISIRRLQCILLKVALILGVQVHEHISFLNLIEPCTNDSTNCYTENLGWRANLEPRNHILSDYEFDVLIGADGKRNTLPGFPRKIVRGKLAIGITANFVNNRTSAEEKVMEISGVAYIFNQAFFNEMFQKTGVDLENIVYYKDDTHYFVMSAKKQSLLQKGVIKQDFDDISVLLSKDNVDQEMLCKYAAQAADFATNGKLPQLTFARNARLQPDVAMFDFTALYSACFSTRLLERNCRHLILTVVGDSLHEPFWPTGSGCARGFLGVYDTAWMLREFGLNSAGPTEIIAKRENVYKLLAQTTKESMSKSYHKYTIDPKTRYKQIRNIVMAEHVSEQVDTDNPRLRPTSKPLSLRLLPNEDGGIENLPLNYSRRYRLWMLCHRLLVPSKLKIVNFKTQSWGDGKTLASLMAKFRPDLIDYSLLTAENNGGDSLIEAVFSVLEINYSMERPCSGLLEWTNLLESSRIDYIEKILNIFTRDLPSLTKKVLTTTPRSDAVGDSWKENSHRKQMSDTLVAKRFMSGKISDAKSQITPTSALSQKKLSRHASVEKLNPGILLKVQQIVSGSFEKEQMKKLRDDKFQAAQRTTKKIEKSHLKEIETKLENAMSSGITANDGLKKETNDPERKAMYLNVADARRKANNGFLSDENRYNDVDQKLRQADHAMKFLPLAGVNILSKLHEQQNEMDLKVTYKLPLKSSTKIPQTTGDALSKPKVPNPSAMSRIVPTIDFARQRQICSICGLEAYLAEKMHLEKMIIHKKCFKCSYCDQPLRLDNCSLDRQLEKEYGLRWFCRQHFHLPLSEKITKLNKFKYQSHLLEYTGGPSIAVVNPTHFESTVYKPYITDRGCTKKTDGRISLADVNSPTSLVSRTMERIHLRELDAGSIGYTTSQRLDFNKPNKHGNYLEFSKPIENTKFGNNPIFIRDSVATEDNLAKNEHELLRNSRQQKMINALKRLKENSEIKQDDVALQQIYDLKHQDNGNHTSESENSSYASSETYDFETDIENGDDYFVEDEIDNDLWQEFHEMLETTLCDENNGEINGISETEAKNLLEKFNKSLQLSSRRPSSQISINSMNSCTFATPAHDNSFYFTPKSAFTAVRRSRLNDANVDDNAKFLSTPVSRPNCYRSQSDLTAEPSTSRHENLVREMEEITLNRKDQTNMRALRTSRLNRLNPRRATVSVDLLRELTSKVCADEAEKQRNAREVEAEYSATELTEPTSGVLIRKQRRERLKQKNLENEVQDLGKLSSYRRRGRSNSTANFPTLTSKPIKNTENDRVSPVRLGTNTTCLALPITPENINLTQRVAQMIINRREKERQLDAQGIQRSLDEIDNRLAEVCQVGVDLERRLRFDPENEWLLENWLFYGEELQRLRTKELELNKRVRIISTMEEYKQLRGELQAIQSKNLKGNELDTDDLDKLEDIEDNFEKEKSLMERMLHIINDHKMLKAELKALTDTSLSHRHLSTAEIRQILADKMYSFKNFEPVFIREIQCSA